MLFNVQSFLGLWSIWTAANTLRQTALTALVHSARLKTQQVSFKFTHFDLIFLVRSRTSTGSSIDSSGIHTTSGQTLNSSTPVSDNLSAFSTPIKRNKGLKLSVSNTTVRTALDDQSSRDVQTARLPQEIGDYVFLSSDIRTALDDESSKDVATANEPSVARSPIFKAAGSVSEPETADNEPKQTT